MSKALGQTNGSNAASLAVAEKYVSAFQELARTNNTLILPSNTGDVSSMVAQVKIFLQVFLSFGLFFLTLFFQALGIYNQLKDKQPQIQEISANHSTSPDSPEDGISEKANE